MGYVDMPAKFASREKKDNINAWKKARDKLMQEEGMHATKNRENEER